MNDGGTDYSPPCITARRGIRLAETSAFFSQLHRAPLQNLFFGFAEFVQEQSTAAGNDLTLTDT